MPAISSQFEVELEKRVHEHLDYVSAILAMGHGIENYAQYQRYVGEIAALNRVIGEFFDDVHKVLNER